MGWWTIVLLERLGLATEVRRLRDLPTPLQKRYEQAAS
jgi:fatty-acid desaturase